MFRCLQGNRGSRPLFELFSLDLFGAKIAKNAEFTNQTVKLHFYLEKDAASFLGIKKPSHPWP